MKIVIKLKKAPSTDQLVVLRGIANVTDVKVSDHIVTCTIPQEEVTSDGKINVVYTLLGGRDEVKSVILVK